jgi:radical SAM superfamily enzyme YgiQ (UPF0313 family)
MKVVLVNPPAKDSIDTELPGFIASAAGVFPPLGLMYLASYLKRHNRGCDVAILDSAAEGKDVAASLAALSGLSPDVVGITAHTQNLLDVISLVRGIKKIDGRIHVTLGGPHATLFPAASIRIEGVDTVVAGEGEAVFSALVDRLSRGGDLKEAPGVVFKEDGVSRAAGPAASLDGLDSYPFPERRGMDLRPYCYALGSDSGLMTTMISGRGCSGSCVFCSTPRTPHRRRSPGNIADEMEECARMGIREVHFVDDTFNDDAGHAAAVCDEVKRRRLPVTWGIRARADKLSEALLCRLKESGCARVNIGAETSSDHGLSLLGKGITVVQVRDAFSKARKAGLTTAAYFMLGCPHEKTAKDVDKTIDFAVELDPDFAMFNLLTPYPGTALYKDGIQRGIIAKDCWEAFAEHPRKDFRIPCWEEWLSRDELEGLLMKAYRRFYLRPGFVLKTLGNTSGLGSFIQKAKVGIGILKGARQA